MAETSIITCKKGMLVHVVRLLTNEEHIRKLATFGILPGVKIKILQVDPAFVLKVGFTEIALDYEIARNIIVSK